MVVRKPTVARTNVAANPTHAPADANGCPVRRLVLSHQRNPRQMVGRAATARHPARRAWPV